MPQRAVQFKLEVSDSTFADAIVTDDLDRDAVTRVELVLDQNALCGNGSASKPEEAA